MDDFIENEWPDIKDELRRNNAAERRAAEIAHLERMLKDLTSPATAVVTAEALTVRCSCGGTLSVDDQDEYEAATGDAPLYVEHVCRECGERYRLGMSLERVVQ